MQPELSGTQKISDIRWCVYMLGNRTGEHRRDLAIEMLSWGLSGDLKSTTSSVSEEIDTLGVTIISESTSRRVTRGVHTSLNLLQPSTTSLQY